MGFLDFLKERRTRKKLSGMDKLHRLPEKIRLRYPKYSFGVGTYGIPEVIRFGQGAVLTVGAYTSIATGVKILLGGEHRTDWVTTYPFPAMISEVNDILDFSTTKGDVVIGSDCWICTDAMILSGVTVGHGAIVAAGAMVNRNVAPFSVVGGNPCKFIRWRFDEETRATLLQSAWWEWPIEEVKAMARTLCSADIDGFIRYINERNVEQGLE
ncbi:CatB-related O-acetyltransferase [Pseudomonas sp. CCI3.2]|uniref:CatB-related O-acetyltransferase n=1 Tax=unclassified Pseudomonas TaxID=196821 RepID=UPI002AC8BD80|nr:MULTISPECIES: CatB-related O-acetyltransferase [unclassified Pseudomonas]MEB0078815.1 CatB-related O-acetyltransferase [Pseudomonas sp. MH10out]MEB0089720.1 CatB-related O-acetyltransferase [Pseudomonas sp. CCI4.2]MEB0103587.1 CatB-related O-acetyltransferase [Pseudomonas sp. CCI3.2]MEB0129009.1 CatB-related O-acetyltransferase [Pseudomonas sp. CCI2.4]MEB0160045.1 CatB-related O-acetyltransferase [Pseudomonas sp. AH2 (2023)]